MLNLNANGSVLVSERTAARSSEIAGRMALHSAAGFGLMDVESESIDVAISVWRSGAQEGDREPVEWMEFLGFPRRLLVGM